MRVTKWQYPVRSPIKSFSGHDIKPVGQVTLPVKHKEQTYDLTFYIVNLDSKPILGAKSCEKLGLVARVNQVEKQSTDIPSDTQEKYSSVFEGLGCIPGQYSIKIDPDVAPVIHAPRQIPVALRDKVKLELDRMEAEGVIIRQDQPTPWVNSMVTPIKSNGKVRICIDPRALNKTILREHFPLKTIDEVITKITDANVFTKLDATSGFGQLKLDDQSKKLCTFNTPWGRYSFTRMPFGIKSASKVYQRAISDMVRDIEGCEAIIDDILIWERNLKEHDERLKRVLDSVQKNNLKLNREMCEFRKDRVKYVGHELSSAGVKPDMEKVRAVQQMKPPNNKKELMTFLGFIQYFAKFIPNLSDINAPLRELLTKDIAWHWDKN
jgi:hypothetical protein